MGRKPASAEVRRVTLKDIAAELNVSLSTVNKALTGRMGVSDEMRKTIMDTANTMGYRVNRLAQSLSRNDLVIGIIQPVVWQEFYGYLKAGMDDMLSDLQDYRITAEYYTVSNLYSHAEIIEGIRYFDEKNVDGIVICPNFECDYNDELARLFEKKVPVVLLGSDLNGAKRLTCVRQNSILSGQMAAEFMAHLLPEGKTSAIFIGNKNMSDHQEKVAGFLKIPGVMRNPTADVYETLDEPAVAYILTQKLIRERPDIGGIYVATSNSMAVCQCIREHNMQDRLRVVGTDIFPSMQQLFDEQLIQGVIFQDPIRQGKIAIRILFDFLTMNKPCAEDTLVYPHMVLASNFPCYMQTLMQHEINDKTAT